MRMFVHRETGRLALLESYNHSHFTMEIEAGWVKIKFNQKIFGSPREAIESEYEEIGVL